MQCPSTLIMNFVRPPCACACERFGGGCWRAVGEVVGPVPPTIDPDDWPSSQREEADDPPVSCTPRVG